MAIQPTRPEAYDTGTLNQYAHIYDVQAEEKRARIAEETEEAARIAADDAEKKARIAADDAEKQARIAADDALGKRIDASAVEQMTPVKLTDDDKTANRQPVASGTRSLAFGPGAKAAANQSVALGAFSQTSSRGNTVAVGSENLQRRIEYVDDPQMDTDAVNLRYFNENASKLPTLDLAQVNTDDNGKLSISSSIYLSSLPADSPAVTLNESGWINGVIGNSSDVMTVYMMRGSVADFSIIGSQDSITGTYKTNLIYSVTGYLDYGVMCIVDIVVDISSNLPSGYVSVRMPNVDDNFKFTNGGKLSIKIDSTRGGIKTSDDGLYVPTATQSAKGIVQGSDSITVTDGVAKVNPSIFGDGLATTDGKVSVDTGFVGEHLAGDALYYDSTGGLMVKAGTGLHIDNDTLSVDQGTLPLASSSNRGTIKVGTGLSITSTGVLSCSSNTEILNGTIINVTGNNIASDAGYGYQISGSGYNEKWVSVKAESAAFAAYATIEFSSDEYGDGIREHENIIFVCEAIVPSSGSRIKLNRTENKDGTVSYSFVTDAAIPASTFFYVHLVYGY